MLVFAAVILWALGAVLLGWWLTRAETQLLAEPPAPAPDPILKTVDKWMHDWDRGRA